MRVVHDGVISDVYDAEGYQCHREFLSHPANISMLLNTDGVAVFNSSSVSMWPIWLQINELPVSQRYLYHAISACIHNIYKLCYICVLFLHVHV